MSQFNSEEPPNIELYRIIKMSTYLISLSNIELITVI